MLTYWWGRLACRRSDKDSTVEDSGRDGDVGFTQAPAACQSQCLHWEGLGQDLRTPTCSSAGFALYGMRRGPDRIPGTA